MASSCFSDGASLQGVIISMTWQMVFGRFIGMVGKNEWHGMAVGINEWRSVAIFGELAWHGWQCEWHGMKVLACGWHCEALAMLWLEFVVYMI
jgi:hypothetical protein